MDFTDPNLWIGLLTLTALEIVLGVDNVIFISILASRLPADEQGRARRLGLGAALVSRLALLFSISWLAGLTRPMFAAASLEFSGRDLVLIAGGLFLIGKATFEIHHKLEGDDDEVKVRTRPSLPAVIGQIMVIDVVFSLDSVITAVGMVNNIWVMVAANVIALGFMLWFSGPISHFVEKHPTIKILALSFLIVIGINLVADGFHQHIPRGYTYFAMAFALGVEMLNLRVRKVQREPVKLREPVMPGQ